MFLSNSKKKISGFTLIEVLIALLILATIATLAITGLQAVILTDKRQIEITDQLAELQFAYIILQRDIAQAINRPIMDSQHEWRPGWLGVGGLGGVGAAVNSDVSLAGEILVEFTRAGVPNPQQSLERSTLQRIAYVYDGKKLLRYEWSLLDRTSDTPVFYRTLLKDISTVQLSYFDQYAQRSLVWAVEMPQLPDWLSNFPQKSGLPSAMEWKFMHPRYGQMLWLFKIDAGTYAQTP